MISSIGNEGWMGRFTKIENKKFSYQNLCSSCKHKSCCTDCDSPFLFLNDLKKLDKIGKSDDRFVDSM